MTTLRIARPTDRLEPLVTMYRQGLELSELGRFADHQGYDGVMLGRPGLGWHLEFTHCRHRAAAGAPSAEHLLVLYEPDPARWAAACRRLASAGFQVVAPENPYWDNHGRTFVDLDDYRVVLQNTAWPA